MTLLEMVRGYQELLQEKEELALQTKENNAAIEAQKEKIAQQMIDDDCPKISTMGYSFSLTPKTIYSKKSAEAIAEAGTDFFDVLREEGMGDIITETVNARTLQSTIKSYVEENGELSEALATVINTYDTFDITRRRDRKVGI